ncbi:DUF2971 domain-containing protein [Clostridium perfringens]|uniref:DUF2971 domain-containing protein n=1 Tax=Clostridium perfringens TaxID=1502 RepID=UPI0028E0C554|nr:DUF2971 domain-containing protein [Clostridium perfringens]MDT9336067.1 DUF2971 domain-containing protein [Clostridium perfringens]MDT9343823.1 DUF2971 domain-containing protein [Clostridium perfringens]MDT9347065.1 DUF2971 domain-containing protein [Clostridium perfringens]MDT9352910.1 DUF2971 domain-containing protein [Clostridium perfringens]
MSEYAELKDLETLVHFTSVDSLIKILITDSIRLSNVNLVNDSYEFLDLELGVNKKIDDRDYKIYDNMDDNEFWGMIKVKELAKHVADYKERLYLTCFYDFTISKDDIYDDYNEFNYYMLANKFSGLDVPSMWAHYGNKNKGVAVVFDKEKLIALFEEQFSNDNLISIHRNIKYLGALDRQYDASNTYLNKIYSLSSKIKNKSNLDMAKEKFLEELARDYYLSKHSDWSIENEYRFLILDKNNKGNEFKLLEKITQAIKGIIFGVKVIDSDIDIIHKLFELKDLNEIGVINKKDIDFTFYEKYPRFHKELNNDIPPYEEDDECKCKECVKKEDCEYSKYIFL